MENISYRIFYANKLVKYAGTDMPSWFTLEKALSLVDRTKGETVWAFNVKAGTTRPIWEVL